MEKTDIVGKCLLKFPLESEMLYRTIGVFWLSEVTSVNANCASHSVSYDTCNMTKDHGSAYIVDIELEFAGIIK